MVLWITMTITIRNRLTKTTLYLAGCFRPPTSEGVLLHSYDDLMSVFDHKEVLSFGCTSGFRAKDKPPQGQTFHTLQCNKGEWNGVILVCNGK